MNTSSEALKMFDTLLQTQSMDDACLKKASELFKEYKKKGIIRTGKFEDNRWYFTDEYSNISMHFSVPEFSYKKYYEPFLGLNDIQFIDYLKTYVMFSMGDVVLSSTRDTLYDINRLLDYDPSALGVTEEKIFLQHPNRVIEFFSMLPEPINTEHMEHLFNVLDCLLDYRYSLNSPDKKRS